MRPRKSEDSVSAKWLVTPGPGLTASPRGHSQGPEKEDNIHLCSGPLGRGLALCLDVWVCLWQPVIGME